LNNLSKNRLYLAVFLNFSDFFRLDFFREKQFLFVEKEVDLLFICF